MAYMHLFAGLWEVKRVGFLAQSGEAQTVVGDGALTGQRVAWPQGGWKESQVSLQSKVKALWIWRMLVLLRVTERAASVNKEEGGSHVELHRSETRSWWSLVCKGQVDQGR